MFTRCPATCHQADSRCSDVSCQELLLPGALSMCGLVPEQWNVCRLEDVQDDDFDSVADERDYRLGGRAC